MMLSGYFLSGKAAKVSSILRVWIEVVTYSWILCGLMLLFGPYDISRNDIYISIFPVLGCSYWFVTVYIAVVISSPVLGKLATILSHHEYVALLSVLFFSISLSSYAYSFVYSPVLWFMFLFVLGSYFRHYESHIAKRVSTRTLFFAMVGSVLFNIGSIYYFATRTSEYINMRGGPHYLMTSDISPLALLIGSSMFLYFGRLNFSNSFINTTASTTFGIYLLHENRLYRFHMWDVWVGGPSHFTKPDFYVFCLVVPGLLFAGLGFVDWIRQLALGTYQNWLTGYLEERIVKAGG